MKLPARLELMLVAAALSLVLFSGCGPKERKLVKVTGKVTRGGQPVVVDKSKSQMIQISFCEVDPSGGVINRFIGDVAEDGTYSATVPLGTLRVAVAFYDPYPLNDTLQDTYGQLTSKQLEEIKGPREVHIELP